MADHMNDKSSGGMGAGDMDGADLDAPMDGNSDESMGMSGESGVEGLERDESVQNPDDFMREDADDPQGEHRH